MALLLGFLSLFLFPVAAILFIVFLTGIRVVNPTERGLIERMGRYNRFAEPGFHYIVPLFESMRRVNVTEQMVDAEPQEVITADNLNAKVDAQVYFKVRMDEDSVKKSQYNVFNYRIQIVALARTTLRDIIGNKKFTEVNSKRGELNKLLQSELKKETESWGIDVVRAELKEIDPPKDVQDSMNKVIKAEKEKEAAVDFATARETTADGEKRARIKEAEGLKQSDILKAEGRRQTMILEAEGRAIAIKEVNEAASKYFKDNAVLLKRLEVTADALRNNSKVVLPSNGQLINVIGDTAGLVPLKTESQQEKGNPQEKK